MQSFLGSGNTYLDVLTAAGAKTGLFPAGNAKSLSIQSNAEIKEQTSKGRDTYGQVLASATLNQPAKIKLSLDQLDGNNLAMAFLGALTDIAIAAASVSAEVLTILTLDKYQRLAQRAIIDNAALIVSKAAGVAADVWAASAAKTAGQFVTPLTGGNGHYYEVTTGGNLSAAEPTWPEDGTTVTDGDVVFTDKGLVVMTKDQDFEIIARTGMFRAITGGDIAADEVLSIAYDHTALTGFKVQGAIQPTIKAYIFLDGKNITNGKDCELEAWEAQLKPTSPVDFLAEDFTSLELEGTLVAPDGHAEPFIVRQFD